MEQTLTRLAYKIKSPTTGNDIVIPKVDGYWSYNYARFQSEADAYRYMIATVRETATNILEETEDLQWKSYCGRAFLMYPDRGESQDKLIYGYWLRTRKTGNYFLRYPASMSEAQVKRIGIIQLRKCCRRFLKNETLP